MASTQRNADVAKLLNRCSAPLLLIDDELTIIVANRACGRLAGCEPNRLIGQKCRYHSEPQPDHLAAFAAAVCPPPDWPAHATATKHFNWNMGDETRAQVDTESETGKIAESSYVIQFHVLGVGDDAVGVLGIISTGDTEPSEPMTDSADDGILPAEIAKWRRELAAEHALEALIGRGPAMQRIRQQVTLARSSQTNTLIRGLRGTGRRKIARTIHYHRFGAKAELTAVACRQLPPDAQRAELDRFLARRAAASVDTPQTLLVEDVDASSLDFQAALAEFLRRPDPHVVVCSTSSDRLDERAADGDFRDDLACNLSTLVIEVPRLADRPEDIPLLCQLFIERHNATTDRQIAGFHSDAMDRLTLYAWPGNVTELAEVVRYACYQSEAARIGTSSLPETIRHASTTHSRPRRSDESIDLDAVLADAERKLILRALANARGNKARAARSLGLTRPKLYRRLVQLGLLELDKDQ